MQSVIGALRAVLGADTGAWDEGLSRAQKSLADFGSKMDRIGGKLSGIGQTLSIGLTAPLVAFGATAAKAATESREAFGQVEAALTSMGGASGKSAEGLKAAAAELQGLSTFDDDEILRKVTANMLTFGTVAGREFDRAQLAAVNLATRLNVDLQAATLQVGKALNDPVKGMTALGRAGIQFTEDQKAMVAAMVAAGDQAGAQGIILGELERQFGGAAAAARKAAPDQAMVDAWREFQETIGELVLNVLPRVTAVLTTLFDWFSKLSPETQTFIVALGGIATVLGPVLFGIGQAITVIGGLATAIGAVMPVLATAGSAFMALVVATGPIGLLVVGIAAAATAAYVFRDDIRAAFTAAVGFARDLYVGVKTWINDKLNAVWDWLSGKIKAAGDAFYNLWDRVVGHSYVPDMIDAIGREFGRLDRAMVDPASVAAAATGDIFEQLGGQIGGIFQQINRIAGGGWKDKVGGVLDLIGGAGGGLGKWGGFAASVFKALPGFANGGNFTVGGMGGIDSNLVAFRATRGEQVSVTRPGEGGGGGGGMVFNIDARGSADPAAVRQQVMAGVMVAIGAGREDLRMLQRPKLARGAGA